MSKIYKSLQDVYAEKCIGIKTPALPRQSILLHEGGAGGHMIHPFDVPGVQSGQDLIEIFEEAVKSIESEKPAVKIDGANVSIKIARDIDGKVARNADGQVEFGIDRGAKTNEEDIKGVTLANLGKRFINKADPSKPHGLIEASSLILNIFNTALPSIEKELIKLGMFKDTPQRFFNMEYVYGQTNVVTYDKNFIAIHGVNAFNPKTREPLGEVNYSSDALESIIKKVRPIAKQFGFDLYSTIPAMRDEEIEEVNFSSALNSELTVLYSRDHAVTKRIGAWLKECNNPIGVKIALATNERVTPYSAKIYKAVTGRVPLDTFIRDNDENMVKAAVCGAVFVQATILMGQILKSALKSDIGHVAAQEGVVVRNLMFKGRPVKQPVKFTGEFIIGKEGGKFAKSQDENEIVPSNDYINPGSNNLNFVLPPQTAAMNVRADGLRQP